MKPALAVVCLHASKAHLFRNTPNPTPLIFSNAVQKSHPRNLLKIGQVVDVVVNHPKHDNQTELVGWGVYNPHSLYRVRLLGKKNDQHRDLATLVQERLSAASQKRAALGLPSDTTDAYRLVNSEGDGLSGLTVDILGEVAVALSSAVWLEQQRGPIIKALLGLDGIQRVVWRRNDSRLKLDGWQSSNDCATSSTSDADDAEDQVPPEYEARGAVSKVNDSQETSLDEEHIIVRENNLLFSVQPKRGQKSGYYVDQRDNRQLVRSISRGRHVLDLFCFSGGFSLAAAAGGAKSCEGVESSAAAVELARSNAKMNNFDSICHFHKEDCFKWLKTEVSSSRRYDLVVCDPPKYAPSAKDLRRATNKYRQLNALAMSVTSPGGLLLTCTCSAAMSVSQGGGLQGGFVRLLGEAARLAGREYSVVGVSGSSSDHVLHPGMLESDYLLAVLLHVN